MLFRKYLFILIYLLISCSLYGQESERVYGKISFLTLQNIYVQFEEEINLIPGDTLFQMNGNEKQAVLIVESASSRACITNNISGLKFVIGQLVFFNLNQAKELESNTAPSALGSAGPVQEVKELPKKIEPKWKENFDARINLAANGSREVGLANYDRLRASFNMEYQNINNGKFSWEHYLTYNQRLWAPNLISSFNENFKVYSGSLTYRINDFAQLSVGRKVNNRLANIGASDGLQMEQKSGNFIYGAFLGARPDVLDYSFNANLAQYGGFISYEKESEKGQAQTSIAFAEQKYFKETDRRFLYFQHSNSSLKNLNFFYSVELDLYQKLDSVVSNKPQLTSTYFTIRYRPSKFFNISLSYDNRRNVIYYESYKSFIDQLINQETRQGYRVQVNLRPNNFINANLSAFYRYQSNKTEPTKNYLASINFSKIPGIGGYAFINYNWMNTYFFDGGILGGTYLKDLFKGKISSELNYRKINYQFFNQDQNNQLIQDIFGGSLNFYHKSKTTLILTYELTIEPNRQYARYFISITQRFKNKPQK